MYSKNAKSCTRAATSRDALSVFKTSMALAGSGPSRAASNATLVMARFIRVSPGSCPRCDRSTKACGLLWILGRLKAKVELDMNAIFDLQRAHEELGRFDAKVADVQIRRAFN